MIIMPVELLRKARREYDYAGRIVIKREERTIMLEDLGQTIQ